MRSKASKIAIATLIVALVAAMALVTGCSSGPAAKAESKDNKVTVTLNGADGVSAFGDIQTKEGEAIKLSSNVTGGKATVKVRSAYAEIYSSRELSGTEEIGITVTAPGALSIEVAGQGKASGTLSFEVVPEADIADMDNGEAAEEGSDGSAPADSAASPAAESATAASAGSNDNAASSASSENANGNANDNSNGNAGNAE